MATTSKQRSIVGLSQAVVYTLIFIAILGGLNFLANRYNKSYDATSNKKFTLSDQTIKVAKNLKQPLKITYWDQSTKFQAARDLLDRYQSLSTNIQVEYSDVDKKRTQAVAAGVKTMGTIFVEVGNKKQEAKSLTEEEITGAMVRSLKGGDRMVCFTLGSGEHSADEAGRDGYSSAKALIEKNNYKTQTLKLLEKSEIPQECSVLLVSGPKRDYIQSVVTAIQNYVENGGRALILIDPALKFGSGVDENAGLMSVLDSWGVTAQKDLVLDISGVGQLFGLGPEAPLVTSYENHAIGREMKEIPTLFPLTRSLEAKNGAKTTVEKLLSTSPNSFATKNLSNPEIRQSANDLKGPLTLGVAGTYTTGKESGNGRFVVVGTSAWISNGFLGFNGNRDLFINMINWLSSDEDLISIRPKEQEDRRLNMNQRQVAMLFYSSVIGIPLLIVFAGVSVWWRRR